MSVTPILRGYVDDAGRFVADEPDLHRRHMQTLICQRVEVTARKERSKRSLDQNAYWHAGPFPILAEYFGCSVEDVKYDLMGEKWGWKPSPMNPNRMIPVKPSTSSMTVEEGTEFTDWLIPWAMTEFKVTLPLPGEVAAA